MTSPLDLQSELDNFAADEESGREAYSFAGRVVERWQKSGFIRRPRPRLQEEHEGLFEDLSAGDQFDGRLPTVVKKLGYDHLSALYFLIANWHAYVVQEAAKSGVEKTEARQQERLLWAMVREHHKHTEKMNDQKASDRTRMDMRYIVANAHYEELKVTWELMKAMQEIAKRDLEAISREITMRGQEAEAHSVGRGFGGRVENQKPRTQRIQRSTTTKRSTTRAKPAKKTKVPSKAKRKGIKLPS
jgi:hypothetical protein